MALCDYHEDLQAVATCVVCKSSICEKCQEHGADGMCGMCLEMANARKAEMEASRQARVAAAANGPTAGARPAASQPPRPPAAAAKPTTAPPRPPGKATTGNLAKPAAATKVVPPAASKPAAKAGFCGEHDGQTLTAACTNCRKKVCPYCLDLYDLCVECRNLPHCSRHESMVAAAKCQSCNLDYCRLCLDNTPFCDRCRTVGMAAVKNSQKAPTGKLDPAKAGKPGTGKLEKPAEAPAAGEPPPKKAPIAPPKPGQPGYRPPGAKGVAPAAKKAGGQTAVAYVFGGIVLLGAAAYILFGDGRPRLTPEEANAALRDEMKVVQAAAIAIQARTGRPPDNVDQIFEQIKGQGLDLKKMNPPLKVVLNAQPTEPLTIVLSTRPEGTEIRATDAAGGVLSENGRDVILSPPQPREDGAEEKPAEEAPKEESGPRGGAD